MKYGLNLPTFDRMADPRLLAELAAEAEAAGWDGVFVWDHVYYRDPARAATDPWMALAAMATTTSAVALGPMVTPLARRRPHIVARQLVALDQLANGRVILGTGLGLDGSGGEFIRFGEVEDIRQRAEMYDEALDLLRALLSGEPVDHRGTYFTASDVRFLPRPVQSELPVWIAARWPNRRPLDRAAKNQGAFIIDLEKPADLATACAYLEERRSGSLDSFDVVVQRPAGDDPEPWREAGATWWLAAFDPFSVTPEDVRVAIYERPGR
ncbi:MAG: LLM class flavin-dependent oxidoreductase [Acidimicrobiales bacterium]|nr:LLM class flavin-dependent oxidoreductase [Acidimicrobiales bacterium]